MKAQATRTWLSGVGDDVNPCSRTAPCKTFAGAISKTAAGGEIDALDPGGFGQLTINKAITIDGAVASLIADGCTVTNNGYGVESNGAGAKVSLSNITVEGNNIGLSETGGGKIVSFGNNRLNGSFAMDGVPTSTVALQ